MHLNEMIARADLIKMGYNRNFLGVKKDGAYLKLKIGPFQYTIPKEIFSNLDHFSEWLQGEVAGYKSKVSLVEELMNEIRHSTWVGCVDIRDQFFVTLKCGRFIQTFKIVSKPEMHIERLTEQRKYIAMCDMKPFHAWLKTSIEKAIQDRKAVVG